jgi:ribosomal protein S12 methylthiotransferase accessory factor
LVQTAPERPIEAVPDHRSETINGDVRALLKGLAQAGMDEVVCVDLTRDDIGLPVVRTVIPGLEGPDDHDGYVPGRRANAVARALT